MILEYEEVCEMPREDARGPEGRGPMTGRRLGSCAGCEEPGSAADPGGAARGRRRGWRNVYRATGIPGWKRGFARPCHSSEDQTQALRNYAEILREKAEEIERHLKELKANDG